METAVRESSDYLGHQWSLADMLGSDLLTAVRRSLEREAGVAVEVGDGGEGLWLKLDSYSLVRALGHLARRLRAEAGVTRFSLDLAEAGRHARLDLGWQGDALAEETLRAWSEEPLESGGGGLASTVRGVVERHGGEVFAQADATSKVGFPVGFVEPTHQVDAALLKQDDPRPIGQQTISQQNVAAVKDVTYRS